MPQHRASAILGTLAVAAFAVGALSGCAPAVHEASTSSHTARAEASASSLPTVTPTPATSVPPTVLPQAPLPSNVLFRITGVATTKEHAVADFVETVYRPVVSTSADIAQITKDCPASGWPQNYPNPAMVHATVTVTLRAGSPAWTEYTPAGLGFQLGNLSSWKGPWADPSTVGCGAPTPIKVPGTASGVAPASPGSHPVGAGDGEGWFNGIYGFSATNNTNGALPSNLVVLSSCALQVSAYAVAQNAKVASWPSQMQDEPGFTCWFGNKG
jgi:hypothetical protein